MKVWIVIWYDVTADNDKFIGVAGSKETAMDLTLPTLAWVKDDESNYRAPLGRDHGYKVFEKVVTP